MTHRSKRLAVGLSLLIMIVVGVMFYSYVPAEYWPRCWWLMLTGTKCPGCGAQRALAALLEGELSEAISHNPLLFAAIPYSLLSIWVGCGKITPFKQHLINIFFSAKALNITIVIILGYWLARNIF